MLFLRHLVMTALSIPFDDVIELFQIDFGNRYGVPTVPYLELAVIDPDHLVGLAVFIKLVEEYIGLRFKFLNVRDYGGAHFRQHFVIRHCCFPFCW